MSCIFRVLSVLALSLVAPGVSLGAESSWDEKLAEVFSSRLAAIRKERSAISPKLEELPGIPIDDQGGTGGLAAIYPSSSPSRNTQYAIEVRWKETATVDMVALVPARRYDAKGLDAQYGVPEEFTVELIDERGGVVREICHEWDTRKNRVRKGHPFVYQVSPPTVAAGMRISARRVNADYEGEGTYVHAWAEALAFEGEKNVALSGNVVSVGGGGPSAPWHWNRSFLVDGETPLGLPEMPEDHGNIGWISEGRPKASESIALTVDLGETAMVDSIRLVPAKRPTSDLPSGFGFPRKIQIFVSDTGMPGDAGMWSVIAERDMGNPGHNPVWISCDPVKTRFVKIEAKELWKAYDDYPGFFALSEVEVLSETQNLALGKPVRSSDGMLNLIAPGGRFWSSAALSDGFGPDGRLVSTRSWINELDERLRLEILQNDLRIEAIQLIGKWRWRGQMTMALLGLAGVFLIIVLPIRYRIHANRELVKVRERIAGDLHDEVGSNLGSIQMFADLAEGRSGSSEELKRIQRIAAETVSAVRDIVWLLRPSGDHRIGTAEHLRETASIMLESLDWKFTANEDAWLVELLEESNRDLFLYFREALHNIMRHAKASKVEIRVEKIEECFKLVIADDGIGIDPQKMDRPATLRALRQRSVALDAELKFESEPGKGTRLELSVPLGRKRKRMLAPRETASQTESA